MASVNSARRRANVGSAFRERVVRQFIGRREVTRALEMSAVWVALAERAGFHQNAESRLVYTIFLKLFLRPIRHFRVPFCSRKWPQVAAAAPMVARQVPLYIELNGGRVGVPPTEEYRTWRRLNPAIGCRFAGVISIAPTRWGQVFEAIPAAANTDRMAEAIAAKVTQFVAEKPVAGAALVLPHLTDLEDTARVMLALGALPQWSITPSAITNEVAGPLVALRLARDIPFGDTTMPSESLLLGDFAVFPPTRRSPITALELFVGEPLPNDPKSGKPSKIANLAHMITRDQIGDKPFDHMWDESVAGRLKSLGDQQDNRAKAKVTFVLPVPMARRLGCAP